MGFFESEREAFELLKAEWREPQLGALGALLGHWRVAPSEPALVALPTGAGKTGVALASPFLLAKAPRRVLVLVPSRALRDQTVGNFGTMRLLREIRALTQWHTPSRIKVSAIESASTDWDSHADSDVVVSIPQSISPANEAQVSIPPSDFFDLVIVDEAHHLPSKTWRSVLEHLDYASALYLTATPFRQDRKPVPGTRVFHYPLRQAITERFYKPIVPVVLPRSESNDIGARDAAIASEVVRLLSTSEHSTSTLLVRANRSERARALADLYLSAGIETEVLTSRLSEEKQTAIIRRLQSGDLRAVAVVGMLGEGFDLPRLRVVGYHDKHKSMPATVQMIGRLARVSDEFPQDSVLVTADDIEVHPELVGSVRELYKEDADWAVILPGLVDAEVAAERENRAFVDALEQAEGSIDLTSLRPMPRPIVYEVDEPSWHPLGSPPSVPEELQVGRTIAGATIVLSAAAEGAEFIAIVTRRKVQQPWSTDPTLESTLYGLSLVSYRAAPRTGLASLLFVDADEPAIHKALLQILNPPSSTRPISTERLDGFMQSLPRLSISSIGMRNILAGTRGTSYKTRAGSSTDEDLLAGETTHTALGHLMMQVREDAGSATVGAAFEKGKIWQRRYRPVVEYSTWISATAELLWFPRTDESSALLPQISRGRTMQSWPEAIAIAVELHPRALLGDYQLFNESDFVANVVDLELHAGIDPTGTYTLPECTDSELALVAVLSDRMNQTSTVEWTGVLSPDGSARALGTDLRVRRGFSDMGSFEDFLSDYPPLIYFLNGQATQGHEVFEVRGASPVVDQRSILEHDWIAAGTDISAETRATATRHGDGHSVHEELERYLLAQPKAGRFRWLICNDGTGEIADYLLIQWSRGLPVQLSLWHAKAAGGDPGLRVDDFQVVTAQALRSRGRFNDPNLWPELCARLLGERNPVATLVDGSDSLSRLLVLLGHPKRSGARRTLGWTVDRSLVQGEICIVQPGLSKAKLLATAAPATGTTAGSLHQLFSTVSETVATTGGRALILGSP